MKSLHRLRRRPAQAGLTLIELMVSLVVGMILTIAMLAVLAQSEGRKRTTNSTNDASMSGLYAMSVIDRAVRSAGGGFSAIRGDALGCSLKVARSRTSSSGTTSTQVLPATSALPTPFGSVNPGTTGQFRLAPVLILPNQSTATISGRTSDVLLVMTGSGVRGDAPLPTTAVPTNTSLPVLNAFGVRPGDMLLVVNKKMAGQPCLVQQAGTTYTASAVPIDLSGATYSSSSINSVALTSYPQPSWVVNLGSQPQFTLLGVGNNNTLFGYDLLQLASPAGNEAYEIADGIFELKALYAIGTDADGDGKFETTEWASPENTNYNLAAMNADPSLMGRIAAIRVGLILRTSLPDRPERDPGQTQTTVTTGNLTLFSGTTDAAGNALTYTRTLTDAERRYRYRTVEMTIPVRNNL